MEPANRSCIGRGFVMLQVQQLDVVLSVVDREQKEAAMLFRHPGFGKPDLQVFYFDGMADSQCLPLENLRGLTQEAFQRNIGSGGNIVFYRKHGAKLRQRMECAVAMCPDNVK